MSKAFLSSSSSHSTITETCCDFYPENSNHARERNLVCFFLGGMKEAVVNQKNQQDYVIDKTSLSTCDNYVSGNHD